MKSDIRRLSILLVVLAAGMFILLQLPQAQSANSLPDNAWSELAVGMQRMHADMAAVQSSGANDVDFVRLMLPYHQAAISMARTQLKYGHDPKIRRLAQEIITDSAIRNRVDAIMVAATRFKRTQRRFPNHRRKKGPLA